MHFDWPFHHCNHAGFKWNNVHQYIWIALITILLFFFVLNLSLTSLCLLWCSSLFHPPLLLPFCFHSSPPSSLPILPFCFHSSPPSSSLHLSLTVTFILLDPTSGRPLSSTTALQVLALKGAVEKMGSYGYQVTGFSKATAASAGDTQLPNSSCTWRTCQGEGGKEGRECGRGREIHCTGDTQISPHLWSVHVSRGEYGKES